MYNEVKNWTDLCKTNVDFLEGKYNNTFYHCAPVDYETNSILDKLIFFNKQGLFTYGSQPYRNDSDEINIFDDIDFKNTRHICKIQKMQFDGLLVCYQKSFLECCCETDLAYKLLPKLLLCNDIYFSFHCAGKNPVWISTFPSDIYNLTTMEYYIEGPTLNKTIKSTNWCKDFYIENNKITTSYLYGLQSTEIIKDLLLNAVDIFIVTKSFDSSIEIVDLLEEISKDLFR